MIDGSPRFLIVRLGALGDVVHGIPVAAALRDALPHARIDWMVDPRLAPLLAHVSAIDRIATVDTRGARTQVLARLHQVRRLRYDVVLDLQGLIKSAVLAYVSGARHRVGFARAYLREPLAGALYTTRVQADARHVVWKNLQLLESVGITNPQVRFPLEIPSTAVSDAVIERFGARRYVLLNPGAAWPNKRWPPERFGRLAAAIRDRLQVPSLVAWGPGEEPLAAAVVRHGAGAAELAPRTSLLDLCGIAAHARVLVSGDTGPVHLAAAFRTPVVGLFGPTDPQRNGPWSASDVVRSRFDTCACRYERRCHKATCCLDSLEVEDVLEAVERRVHNDDAS